MRVVQSTQEDELPCDIKVAAGIYSVRFMIPPKPILPLWLSSINYTCNILWRMEKTIFLLLKYVSPFGVVYSKAIYIPTFLRYGYFSTNWERWWWILIGLMCHERCQLDVSFFLISRWKNFSPPCDCTVSLYFGGKKYRYLNNYNSTRIYICVRTCCV